MPGIAHGVAPTAHAVTRCAPAAPTPAAPDPGRAAPVPGSPAVAAAPANGPGTAELSSAAGAGDEPGSARPALRVVTVSARDPLAAPLLTDLGREYDERYADMRVSGDGIKEIDRYPAGAFDPPHGCFLLLLEGDVPVSGGAFMRYDEATAELKRIWTSADHRGRGLGRRILAELEHRAAAQGYTRAFLTTGPRQPEAVALYLRSGYTPLYDRSLPPEEVGMHPFAKSLRD